ncbi:hypothetical protein BHU72_01370 [Desulfuribacillus stibiiarsenatis]|uniref:Uncharacterized protein n=1 Tax=Desulfuribacillus stibiiarsenatis TaxID=1390249 RepID=A0A1E5L9Y5_9FIRM|nr:DUF523 domain-containing protein [Desulfuribacillus stibiiarsenatis]OEH86937.1 hypothetical protein BHU72_01370 [Desulfuribacillus stibiiarsenatis]
MIIVSACLVGYPCKYNGTDNKIEQIYQLIQDNKAIAVCPEVLGELSTPREPAEIVGGTGEEVLDGKARVMTCKGEDITQAFMIGAEEVLRIAQQANSVKAILKERSPSCGSTMIYSGEFNQRKIPGCGVTTALLRRNGIEVVSEESI